MHLLYILLYLSPFHSKARGSLNTTNPNANQSTTCSSKICALFGPISLRILLSNLLFLGIRGSLNTIKPKIQKAPEKAPEIQTYEQSGTPKQEE